MGHTFVKDIMKPDIASIESSKSIKEAAAIMDEKNVGCLIVTQDNNPIGIVTERDFVRRVSSKEKSLASPISEVVSKPLISIDLEETVWEAAQKMKVNNIHKLAVKEKEKVIGIVTTTDLVKICSLGSDSEMRRICDQILTRMEKTI